MLPLGVIEQALKLINLLLESTAPAQRQAQLLIWFWMWWPVAKLFLNKEQEEQIEKLMKGLANEPTS